MSKADEDTETKEAGYRRPPKATQFQKGVSGNPKGRKAKQSSTKESKEDDRTTTYDIGFGKPPKHTQFRKGVSGNPYGQGAERRFVESLLRNRLYLGELSCQGEFVVAEHPALIEPEVFEKVQRMLEPKVRRDRHECRNPTYLIRGTLKCGICGCRMTSASTFRHGRLYRYYRCRTRDKQGKAVCPTVQMPAEAIEAFVVERVQGVLGDPQYVPALTSPLQGLGLQAPGGNLGKLWEVLTPISRQRLIRLLVEEAVVDQRSGQLRVRLRDLRNLTLESEATC